MASTTPSLRRGDAIKVLVILLLQAIKLKWVGHVGRLTDNMACSIEKERDQSTERWIEVIHEMASGKWVSNAVWKKLEKANPDQDLKNIFKTKF